MIDQLCAHTHALRYNTRRRKGGNKVTNEKQKLRYKVKRERKVSLTVYIILYLVSRPHVSVL